MVGGEASLIIYDGDCVFCQNYVRFMRLRETIGPVELLDARSGDPRVERYWRDGYNLNEGMLFVHKGGVHHGAEAVRILAALSSPDALWSRLNGLVFSNGTAAALLYPLLKLGRRATLLARGKRLIDRPPSLTE